MGRAGDSIYDDVNPGTADITKLSWVVKDATGTGTASKELNASDLATLIGSGGGGITQLSGDVTAGPGTGLQAATIAANAVTYAKMQAANAVSRLVGSSDGSTALTNITLGTNLSMSGSTLNAAGGGGSPGGSNTHVQFNNSGAFGGAAGLTWDGTNLAATNLRVGDGTLGAPSIAFTSDADGTGTGLYRSAANEIAVAINGVRQINFSGATAGTGSIRLINTYTDASNYERGVFKWSSSVLEIGTEAAGTGTARELALRTGGTNRWKITTTGQLETVNWSGPANGAPLRIQVDGAGAGFIVGYTATEYVSFIAGGVSKGFAGSGSIPFKFSNGGDIHFDTSGNERFRIRNAGGFDIPEVAAPGSPAANTARLYVEDNGAGKTRLVVIFPTGAAQVLATEP